MRIGMGYDVHQLVKDRKLIIGGVDIPYHLGLMGHSDADVLLHAIMDALLGAAGLGDIGCHFPDKDETYRGISSLELLKRVGNMLKNRGLFIENMDATLIAQSPKLMPHFKIMKGNIADTLSIIEERINLKATTTEGLGFEGKGEGIAAQAVVLLRNG